MLQPCTPYSHMASQEVKRGNGYRLCEVKSGRRSVLGKQNSPSVLVSQSHEQGPTLVSFKELNMGETGGKPSP